MTPAAILALHRAQRQFPALPRPGCNRWTAERKEVVLDALRHGALSPDIAIELYDLTPDELESWIRRYSAHGRRGLAATKLRMLEAVR